MFSNDENDENEVRAIYSSCIMTFNRIRVHYLWAIIDVSAL